MCVSHDKVGRAGQSGAGESESISGGSVENEKLIYKQSSKVNKYSMRLFN